MNLGCEIRKSEGSFLFRVSGYARLIDLPVPADSVPAGGLALWFKAEQSALIERGQAHDACGRCGCSRAKHLPTKSFSYAKSGGSSGKSHEVPVMAPTSCECKTCFCFCAAFVEPFEEQPFSACTNDPEFATMPDFSDDVTVLR